MTFPMDEAGSDARLREIASRFSELGYVEAVALAGSVAAGTSDSQSDYDLYVYSHQPVEAAFRDSLLRPRAQRLDLHRSFWEDEDVWIEHDAIEFQIMYRSCAWTEDELSARLDRCEAMRMRALLVNTGSQMVARKSTQDYHESILLEPVEPT